MSWGSAWLHTARTRFRPRQTVLFYPNLPQRYAVAYRLCVLHGCRMTNDPAASYHAAIRWLDQEVVDPATLPEWPMLNAACNDITKTHISRVFARVFGYDLMVDPTTYTGSVVKKSDLNAKHDGEVIACPIPPSAVDPGCVYQKEIVSLAPDGATYFDYRVPIHGEVIPLVYMKHRPLTGRFKEFSHVELVPTEKAFSPEEREQLLAFCRAVALDYGELDVLRDRGDGRIYVVDANNTPSGPNRGFRPAQRLEALTQIAPSFFALLARHESISSLRASHIDATTTESHAN